MENSRAGRKNAPCEEKLEKSTCHFFNFYFISVMRFFGQKWGHSIILGRYLPYKISKSGKMTFGPFLRNTIDPKGF